MNPRHAFFACLERSPPALFEAALWIAAEHDPTVQPLLILQELNVAATAGQPGHAPVAGG